MDLTGVCVAVQYSDVAVRATALDVNEPPLWNVTTGVALVPENNGSIGAAFFTLPLPDDPDDAAGLRIRYSIVNASASGRLNFRLSGRSVVVSTGALLNFEDPARNFFVLVVQAQDDFLLGVCDRIVSPLGVTVVVCDAVVRVPRRTTSPSTSLSLTSTTLL
jgi:hypothetical protein